MMKNLAVANGGQKMKKLDPEKINVNRVVGNLDRLLSEFLYLCKIKASEIDIIDRQTLKHHADDLIGVGQKGLDLLKPHILEQEIKMDSLVRQADRLGIGVDHKTYGEYIGLNVVGTLYEYKTRWEAKTFLDSYSQAKEAFLTPLKLSPTLYQKSYLIDQTSKYGLTLEVHEHDTLVLRKDTRLLLSATKGNYEMLALFMQGYIEGTGERDKNNLYDENFEKRIEKATGKAQIVEKDWAVSDKVKHSDEIDALIKKAEDLNLIVNNQVGGTIFITQKDGKRKQRTISFYNWKDVEMFIKAYDLATDLLAES